MAIDQALVPWHDFLIATAGAGGVFFGLVFVGLTLHLERRTTKPALFPLAVNSAVTLFYPVLISLLLLMPPLQPWLPSVALVVVAGFATLAAGAPIFDAELRAGWLPGPRAADLFRYVVPWLAALALIGVALWLLVEPEHALYAIALINVLYLIVGTQNAWNILLAGRVHVGISASREHDRAGGA